MDIAMQYTILEGSIQHSIIVVGSIQYEYLKFECNIISCYNYNSGIYYYPVGYPFTTNEYQCLLFNLKYNIQFLYLSMLCK